VVLLDVEGNVLKINPVAARILRLDREHIARADFANMGWAGEVTLEDGTVLNQEYFELQGIPGTGKVIISEEAILRFPDGSQRWLRGSVTPLTRDSEAVTGIIITFMDITGEKNQQEQLTQKLLEAQEIERKRIGRELHDDTAQSLSLISLELDSLAGSSRLCTEDVTAKLESLKTITDRTMQDVRRYSHELHPVILDHLGLVPALEQLAEDVSEHNGLKVDIAVQGEEIKLNPQEELALFRIAQEALSNIRKHAQATQARISLSYQLNSVNLRIIDNGIGFRVSKEQKSAISRGSLGLLSMKERAHLIGANLRIESTINQGTTIAVEMKAEEKNPGKTPLL
jgi:PAS domain S-box-containing protein